MCPAGGCLRGVRLLAAKVAVARQGEVWPKGVTI